MPTRRCGVPEASCAALAGASLEAPQPLVGSSHFPLWASPQTLAHLPPCGFGPRFILGQTSAPGRKVSAKPGARTATGPRASISPAGPEAIFQGPRSVLGMQIVWDGWEEGADGG